MAAQGVEDVYASLLLTDTYLPGALVLAHSLRDAGTTKKLAILVTLDTVSVNVLTQLKTVYDYVIPVSRIQNEHPANLDLMNRRDLHSAFTKINLWKQTQFRKIVYVDADVVAYRAPDELFDLPHAFSAAPDIGWPDLFNTGLMVLTPNMGDYYAMMAMAQRGISFDGADQGLLNMYYKQSFHRLSFTYNVTPSAHYQYVPAYRHFQSSINMVHFIGTEKPWIQGRDRSTGSSPFDQMVGRWWAVYDRHYRKETYHAEPCQSEEQVPEIVQYFVKGEYRPTVRYVVPVGEPPSDTSGKFHGQHYQPSQFPPSSDMQYSQHQHQHHSHQTHHALPEQHQHHHVIQHQHQHQHHHQHRDSEHGSSHSHSPPTHSSEPSSHSVPHPSVSSGFQTGTHTEARKDQASDHQQWNPQPPTQTEHKPEPQPQPQPQPAPSWDAQRQPPPPDSKPEAMNFPHTQYEMSSDTAQFVPPARYPSPPKNMWYEVPKAPPAKPQEKPKPVFPWETHKPRPSRVFAEPPQPEPPAPETTLESAHASTGEDTSSPQPGSQTQGEPEGGSSGSPGAGQTGSPQTSPPGPTSRTALSAPTDIWSSFPRTNAWDSIPEINRYVDRKMQQHRRTRSQQKLALAGNNGQAQTEGQSQSGEGDSGSAERRGSKVTDFPSVDDRPSLPVTPAPIRRPRRWGSTGGGGGFGGNGNGDRDNGDDDDDEEQLPAAEGVPGQADWVCVHGIWWSPADCLCDLANVLRHHKDPVAQLQKLAKEQSEMLFQRLGSVGGGEEGGAGGGGGGGPGGEEPQREIPSRPMPFGSEDVVSPTYVAASGANVVSPKPVKPQTGASPVNRILAGAGEETQSSLAGSTAAGSAHGSMIPEPSYHGPGLMFEKGEDYPTFETPMPPTEEERDVLDT